MNSQQSAGWIAEQVCSGLAEGLEAMTGVRYPVRYETSAAVDVEWSRYCADVFPEAAFWLGAESGSAARLGEAVLRAAGIEAPDAASIRNAFEETLGQAAASLGRALSTQTRQKITVTRQAGAAPGGTAVWYRIQISPEGGAEPVSVALAVSPEAAAGIAAPREFHPEKPLAAAESEEGPAAYGKAPRMDLLLDVELPVSVSFGQAQLPLRDVIKLTTGSIIELNRTISEPVEVIVNNCVIARGEVVVVEGNFGIRIQQVVSRQERLRSIE